MNEDDHDLLVELANDIKWVKETLVEQKKNFTNHLRHHWVLEVGIILAFVGAVIAKLFG